MARTTKIVGFSLPPEVYVRLEKFSNSRHKTRSEFLRELIDTYSETAKFVPISSSSNENLDLAKILKTYWILRSQMDLEIVFIGLAVIVNKKGEILIGARKDKDAWVKNLSWGFPSGQMKSLDFAGNLKERVKSKTNLEIRINSLISARVHPDAGFKKTQIVAFYFYCSPVNNTPPKPIKDIKELKWVKPEDVFKYFTTSTSDEVTKFLLSIGA